MRRRVARQGIQLRSGWGVPLCCLIPLVTALVAVAFELLPGWEDYLLLATCPLCHLLVIWFARHHLMYNEEAGTLRDL